jgi:hypothetical protein
LSAWPEDFRRNIPRCAAFLGDGFILRREDSETKVGNSHIILIISVDMIDKNVVNFDIAVDDMLLMDKI